MGKISVKNQLRLIQAEKYGIDLSLIRKKYTLQFALSLFNYLEKETLKQVGNRKEGILMMYPKGKLFTSEKTNSFVNDLEEAGFSLVIKYDDFIDEDTGKIVTVPRPEFETLSLKK